MNDSEHVNIGSIEKAMESLAAEAAAAINDGRISDAVQCHEDWLEINRILASSSAYENE